MTDAEPTPDSSAFEAFAAAMGGEVIAVGLTPQEALGFYVQRRAALRREHLDALAESVAEFSGPTPPTSYREPTQEELASLPTIVVERQR